MVKPYPAITKETEFFWTGGETGELKFQQCRSCGHFLHPPMPNCPECLSDDIDIKTVSGKATIAACSVNHHPWHPDFPPPYVLAIVEIAEAPYVRLTTQIVNCEPDEPTVGAPVKVVFQQQGPAWMPMFELERG